MFERLENPPNNTKTVSCMLINVTVKLPIKTIYSTSALHLLLLCGEQMNCPCIGRCAKVIPSHMHKLNTLTHAGIVSHFAETSQHLKL